MTPLRQQMIAALQLRACLGQPPGLAPNDGNEVSAQDRELTTPEPGKRKKKKKTAHRGSLSLDKGSPHKG
jgi:hypothetical protein